MFVEYYFKTREARDRTMKWLRESGYTNFKGRSVSGCVLSPEAVSDLTPEDYANCSKNGFGGLSDKWWPKLYTIVRF